MKKTRYAIRNFVTADPAALPRARAWGLKVKPLHPGRPTTRQRKAAAAASTAAAATSESLPVDLSDTSARVDLRLDESSATLRGVAAPTIAAIAPASASDVPGGLFRLPDGRECHILYSDGSLSAIVDFQSTPIASLGAIPRFVLPVDGGASLLVMPASGRPMLFRYDSASGSWSDGALYPDLPAITLVRNDMDSCSVEIPTLTLADSYGSTSRQLTDRDVASVSSRLANARTKILLINHLISLVRDGGYIEHDDDALAELSTYEQRPDGSYGAKDGKHDDILMSRAIALWVATADTASIAAHTPLPASTLTFLLSQ